MSANGLPVDSFLMIGQSNMAGRGDIGTVEPILDPDLLMLRNCRWQPLSEPVNPDRGVFSGKYRSGIGLAPEFAKRYLEFTGRSVGLIPCADGGTSLDSWQKGGPLYENALFQTRMAMKISTLRGILWHQGEADVTHPDRVASYADRFVRMIGDLFGDLGIDPVPVIAGELGEYLKDRGESYSAVPEFNRNLRSVGERLPLFGVASAAGLSCRPDILHFDAPSLRVFGDRYFAEYLRLTEERGAE
ncbi:MAG: sialate O-acetylesterase [Clostridia bacterium]|nr:sialate O-acetylesterase [Clostridia bacterium]